MSRSPFLLLTLPCLVLSSVTLPAPQLFQNTLQRWGITPSSEQDRSERWQRHLKMRESVELSTTGVFLESLNLFSVMNDQEYAKISARLFRNTSDPLLFKDAKEHPLSRKRKRSTPATFTKWQDIGFLPAKDQLGCGSCWSFPTTAALEILYKELTGEVVDFSEQYFVDCTLDNDGCAGGLANDGFAVTKDRQYLVSTADLPYTGFYDGCALTSQIASRTNNAMKKIWFQEWYRTSQTEAGMLAALQFSPVAYIALTSGLLNAYSGGLFTDENCVTQPYSHAMSLVGYTETYFNVRGSWGTSWGEDGYVRYLRGAAKLNECDFYKNAYYIQVDIMREMEYEFCNDIKVSTYAECRSSCLAMNTDTKSGWDLAVIPTIWHNSIVADKANTQIPNVKTNDKFNYFWMGLTYDSSTGKFSWVDDFTQTGYLNFTSYDFSKPYGTINKNDGSWLLKSDSDTDWSEARGLCSRPVTCFDISTSVANGDVTFDREDLTEGTTATASCDDEYTISGTSTLTCAGGKWSSDLPTCIKGQGSGCTAPSIDNGSVSPTTAIPDGDSYTVTCDSGYELNGNSEITCTGSQLSTSPTCEASGLVCSKPTINRGTVTPSTTTISVGNNYTVICDLHYKISGEAVMNCTESNGKAVLSTAPTCVEETCNATEIAIDNGSIKSGAKSKYTFSDMVTLQCDGGYVLSGNSILTCMGSTWISVAPTCIAINTNCGSFSVANGMLSNADPYFTGDSVKVMCNIDYSLSGTSPRVCETAGWKTGAPTCEEQENECIALSAPSFGSLSCTGDDNGKMVAGTNCSVTCNAGYVILGQASYAVCGSDLLWSTQNPSNTLGDFPPCTLIIEPAGRSLRSRVSLSTQYCTNDVEKGKVYTALGTFLENDLSVECLGNGKCQLGDTKCFYRAKHSDTRLVFKLDQKSDLTDKTILKTAKSTIKTSVRAKTFVLSVSDVKRRKRATSLSADENSLESEDEVSCGDGEALTDGQCVKCPEGYKTDNGTCVACPVGSYNAAEGATDCTECSDGKTTYGEGSTKEDQCYTLCTVPTIPYGSLSKGAGYKVAPSYVLGNLTCEETYSPSTSDSFECSQYNSSLYTCDPLDQCKSSTIVLEHGSITGDSAPYDQGESVTFTCDANYKLFGTAIISCIKRTWSNNAATCTAVNSNCATYTVENGVLDKADDTVFTTGESVKLACNYGYEEKGTNPRVCQTAGWATDAPTCAKNDGSCISLEAPTHGSISCSGEGVGETCTVSCNSGYLNLNDDEEISVTCQSTLLWTHQAFDNSLGAFEPCVAQVTPQNRSLESQVYLLPGTCDTVAQQNAVLSAFETALEDKGVTCLSDNTCSFEDGVCRKSSGGDQTIIDYTLLQSSNFGNTTILSAASTVVYNLVQASKLQFSATYSKKRATSVSITAEPDSYTATEKTYCSNGQASLNSYCYNCPAGYYVSGTSCNECPVGEYNPTAGATSCTTCPSDTTTYGTGSSSSDQCMDLCIVPGVTFGSTLPPTGYRVSDDTVVTLTCDSGKVTETETFTCGSGIDPTCGDEITEEVSDEDGNTTTIVIVVVVVLLVIALIIVAVIIIKKRDQGPSEEQVHYNAASARNVYEVPVRLKEALVGPSSSNTDPPPAKGAVQRQESGFFSKLQRRESGFLPNFGRRESGFFSNIFKE